MKNATSERSSAQPAAPKIRRHRIREILIGFGILVVLVMITPAILSLFFKDIPPVSAPDLALNKVTVPVADNAYFDLLKLDQATVDVSGVTDQLGFINGVLAGVQWDQAVVDDALAKNAEALGYFADAAKKSSYQFPAYADPVNIDPINFLSLGSVHTIGRLAALKAVNLQKQGKEAEAFQQALTMTHVGTVIEHSRTPLVGFLVGRRIEALGSQTLQRLLTDTKLTSAVLVPYAAQIQNSGTMSEDFSNAFKMEHMFRIGYIEEAVQRNHPDIKNVVEEYQQAIPWRLWTPRSYYFQPNKIISEWNDIDRSILAASTTPCAQQAPEIQPPAPYSTNMFRFWLRLYFLPNAIGQLLHEVGFVSLGSARTVLCNDEALNSATRTLIALKAFSQDNGALPITLEQLVPTYLPSLPIDPYDGKAIKYSAEKKIIYSVGSDHVDIGGSTGDDWQKMDDPTFAVK